MPKNNHQKNLSWCFAWSTTDLLSFHEEIPLSSYDLGFQYHNHDIIREAAGSVEDFTLKGGIERLAMIVAIQSKKGLCTEEQTNFKESDWAKLSDYFKLLASPKKSLKSIICYKQARINEPFNKLTDDINEKLQIILQPLLVEEPMKKQEYVNTLSKIVGEIVVQRKQKWNV